MKGNKKAKTKQRKKKNKSITSFPMINPDSAGIDLGSKEHWVAIPPDRDKESVRTFKCFTADLESMANWLLKCNIKTVAMEATGAYWIPVFELLASKGLQVVLVNARHVKNVSGRKSDVMDCQWIQRLHSCGLLSASFRPEDGICVLRGYWRHRENLVRYAASHIQHMQKALEQKRSIAQGSQRYHRQNRYEHHSSYYRGRTRPG